MAENKNNAQVLWQEDHGDMVSWNNYLFWKNDALSILDWINESSLSRVNFIVKELNDTDLSQLYSYTVKKIQEESIKAMNDNSLQSLLIEMATNFQDMFFWSEEWVFDIKQEFLPLLYNASLTELEYRKSIQEGQMISSIAEKFRKVSTRKEARDIDWLLTELTAVYSLSPKQVEEWLYMLEEVSKTSERVRNYFALMLTNKSIWKLLPTEDNDVNPAQILASKYRVNAISNPYLNTLGLKVKENPMILDDILGYWIVLLSYSQLERSKYKKVGDSLIPLFQKRLDETLPSWKEKFSWLVWIKITNIHFSVKASWFFNATSETSEIEYEIDWTKSGKLTWKLFDWDIDSMLKIISEGGDSQELLQVRDLSEEKCTLDEDIDTFINEIILEQIQHNYWEEE